jgi:phosphatidylethanolamine/phosphatidyl-N-methylethanolamine N-methyltransferase
MAVPLRQVEQFGLGRADASRSTAGSVALVGQIYSAFTPFYDFLCGPLLQLGRTAAIARMGLQPGTRVLEVGVGTALDAALYPADCEVVGIDISAGMLEKARERLRLEQLDHVRVTRMDAAAMTFPDESFDVVYAPYTISTVPDPVAVAREMRRVCRTGGQIIFLGHFMSRNAVVARLEQLLTGLTERIGFRMNLDLRPLLVQAQLRAISIESVNLPPIWSLVVCRKNVPLKASVRQRGPGSPALW